MSVTVSQVGDFTVMFRRSAQHPAGLYTVSRNGTEVGRAASMPDLDDCQRMANHQAAEQRARMHAADLGGALKTSRARIRPTPMEVAIEHALANAPGHGLAAIKPASRRRGNAHAALTTSANAKRRRSE